MGERTINGRTTRREEETYLHKYLLFQKVTAILKWKPRLTPYGFLGCIDKMIV